MNAWKGGGAAIRRDGDHDGNGNEASELLDELGKTNRLVMVWYGDFTDKTQRRHQRLSVGLIHVEHM